MIGTVPPPVPHPSPQHEPPLIDVPHAAPATGQSCSAMTASLTTPATTLIVRHHGLRHVSEQDVLAAVGGLGALSGIPRQIEIDTAPFAQDVENAGWGASHGAVWRSARDLRAVLQATPDARVIYAGLAEVPHVVAFGAYLGDEWTVEIYDHHRGMVEGTPAWAWPADTQTLTVETTGLPRERMGAAGPAVLRIEISATVDDAHVREFVPESEEIAHVRIRPRGATPSVADLVRSPADVREVRRAVREAVAALVELRPNLTTIHLFIAAPVSACFVTGQELRVSNNPPVQTYRFRRGPDGVGVTRQAIRLTAAGPAPAESPLTEQEQARALVLRTEVWDAALRDVERYAGRKRREAARRATTGGDRTPRWYEQLMLDDEWRRVRPFPTLPPVQEMIDDGSVVDPVSMENAFFGYQRDQKRWRVNDRFLVGLDRAFGGDLQRSRTLVRLFMFHEALHVAHGITKAKVEEIGKFANGLEHVDYTADLYAVLHELDRAVDEDPSLSTFDRLKALAADLIDLVVRSFWAFEDAPPLERMEIRRLRRYMNWYWQQIRVRMSRTPLQLAAVLARKPIVEIAGLEPQVESRRHYGSLHRFDRLVGLELGIVLDNEEIWRIASQVTVPLTELMDAFSRHAHEEIQQVFRGVFENAVGSKHALPNEEDIP